MSSSLIGKTLGNYRINGMIGGGGVGHVWRAEDTTLGRTVAIKALRPELAGNSSVARRFRSEAQTLARLSHPNIATVFALLEHGGELFMVLEFVEGQTVASLLRSTGPLEIEPCFELLHQVFDGIGHAHEAGVIHRDIKPSNLMVDGRGLVKVMDFGIARTSGSDRMTLIGGVVGTPEYMSPEQIRGQDGTIRSDIYALGILVFEMLTGRPPFRKEGDFDVMRAQVEQIPPRPRSLRADLSIGLEEVILQALSKAPEARFADVEALRSALVAAGAPGRTSSTLRALLSEATTVEGPAPTPSQATTLPGIAARPPRRARLHRALSAAAVLALALGANALHVERSAPGAGPPVDAAAPALHAEAAPPPEPAAAPAEPLAAPIGTSPRAGATFEETAAHGSFPDAEAPAAPQTEAAAPRPGDAATAPTSAPAARKLLASTPPVPASRPAAPRAARHRTTRHRVRPADEPASESPEATGWVIRR